MPCGLRLHRLPGGHVRASPLQGFRIGDWMVEPMLSRINGPSGSAHLEPRAMDVLVALAQRAGELVSRDDLIAAVWKHPHVTDEALSRCISILRHVLSDDQDEPRYIETVRKRGYRLIPLVEATRTAKPEASVSIAVLPFLNLSGDPGEEHLADGVTELLITNLASLPGLAAQQPRPGITAIDICLLAADIRPEITSAPATGSSVTWPSR